MLSRPAPRWSSPCRRLADERGFSLVELVAVMAILGIVIAALSAVFVSSTKAEVDMNLRFQAQQEARLALDRLRREGHSASLAVVKNSAGAAVPTNTWGAQVTLTFGAATVTWCTRLVSASRYALWRDPNTACTAGVKVADHLIQGDVFRLPTVVPPQRQTLGVRFHVDVDPQNTARVYRLNDDIVLRNSPRT